MAAAVRPEGLSPANASPHHLEHSCSDPQSQSFSQSYGSILPTSLTYIVLSTRGCSPWRPAAVIGTTTAKAIASPGFSWAVRSAPDTAQDDRALPAINLFASQTDSKVLWLLKRKDNSSRGSCQRLQVHLRYRRGTRCLVPEF